MTKEYKLVVSNQLDYEASDFNGLAVISRVIQTEYLYDDTDDQGFMSWMGTPVDKTPLNYILIRCGN